MVLALVCMCVQQRHTTRGTEPGQGCVKLGLQHWKLGLQHVDIPVIEMIFTNLRYGSPCLEWSMRRGMVDWRATKASARPCGSTRNLQCLNGTRKAV